MERPASRSECDHHPKEANPQVAASDGTEWLAVLRPSGNPLVRINLTGAIISDPVDSPDLDLHTIAFSGGRYLCFGESLSTGDLLGQFVQVVSDDLVFDTPFRIATENGTALTAYAAGSGGSFLVAWES